MPIDGANNTIVQLTDEVCDFPECNREIVALRLKDLLVAICPVCEIANRRDHLNNDEARKTANEFRKECTPVEA